VNTSANTLSLKRPALIHCQFAVLVLALGDLSGAAQTSFTVTPVGLTAYSINGTNNPTLTLTRGVTYLFNVNATGHPFWIKSVSSTGTNNAYANGVVNNGVQVGTLSFAMPTNAPTPLFYNCQFHIAMKGTLNIVDPPSPPIVALTNPPSGITLAAPATITLRASASDPDGSVTNVQFLSGTTLLGNDTNSPYSLTASNLAANTYNFTARATDNSGLSATSAVVTVSVVTPGTIRFGTNLALVSGQLPLRLTVTPGLRYQIESTGTFTNWFFFTNFLATNSIMNFSSPTGGTNRLFFRALLLPNP
jgi:hypothetical protein